MSYTPVPAVAAGDTIDEVFINTYWVDNMAAGVPDIFSAKGQLAVGLGVDEVGVLNVGADGTVLSSDAAMPLGMKWLPLGQTTILGKSNTQLIVNPTIGVLTWDIEVRDDENLHSISSNPERITFSQSGIYILFCSLFSSLVSFAGGGIAKNGTIITPFSLDNTDRSIFPVLLNISAGDYVEVHVKSISASTTITTASSLSVTRLGK